MQPHAIECFVRRQKLNSSTLYYTNQSCLHRNSSSMLERLTSYAHNSFWKKMNYLIYWFKLRCIVANIFEKVSLTILDIFYIVIPAYY